MGMARSETFCIVDFLIGVYSGSLVPCLNRGQSWLFQSKLEKSVGSIMGR